MLQTAKVAEDQVSRGEPNHLKAWRKHRRLTQEKLAEKVGTTGPMISLLERGERMLTDHWLAKLAAALNITKGTLYDRAPGQSAEIYNLADRLDDAGQRVLLNVARSLAEERDGYKAS